MTETLPSALQRVAGFLTALGWPHAIIGGVAVIARVRARATEDIDVLIAIPPDSRESLLELAPQHGYTYGPTDREMFADGLIRLAPSPRTPSGVSVDVLVADSAYLRQVVSRATLVELGVRSSLVPPSKTSCS